MIYNKMFYKTHHSVSAMNSLPPQVWYTMLSSGPLLLYNPEILRCISRAVRDAIDEAFSSAGFWQTYMQSCFPNLASKIPLDIRLAFHSTNGMWRLYACTARLMFATLHIRIQAKRDKFNGKMYFNTSPFNDVAYRCVAVHKSHVLIMPFSFLNLYESSELSLCSAGSNFHVFKYDGDSVHNLTQLLKLHHFPCHINLYERSIIVEFHKYSADAYYLPARSLYFCLGQEIAFPSEGASQYVAGPPSRCISSKISAHQSSTIL